MTGTPIRPLLLCTSQRGPVPVGSSRVSVGLGSVYTLGVSLLVSTDRLGSVYLFTYNNVCDSQQQRTMCRRNSSVC